MEIKQASNQYVSLKLHEGDNESKQSLKIARTFLHSIIRGVGFGSDTAILFGSIFADYIADEIDSTYHWREGVDFVRVSSINSWESIYFYGKERAMFFSKPPKNWSEVDLEQAQTCSAIIFFVNYRGPDSIDELVAQDRPDEENISAILQHCDFMIRVSDDGFGLEVLLRKEVIDGWGLDIDFDRNA